MLGFSKSETNVICESMHLTHHLGVDHYGAPEYLCQPRTQNDLFRVIDRGMGRGKLTAKFDVDGEALLRKVSNLTDEEAPKVFDMVIDRQMEQMKKDSQKLIRVSEK